MAIRLDFCGAIMVFLVSALAFRPSKIFMCPPGGAFAVLDVSGISTAQIGLVLTYISVCTRYLCAL